MTIFPRALESTAVTNHKLLHNMVAKTATAREKYDARNFFNDKESNATKIVAERVKRAAMQLAIAAASSDPMGSLQTVLDQKAFTDELYAIAQHLQDSGRLHGTATQGDARIVATSMVHKVAREMSKGDTSLFGTRTAEVVDELASHNLISAHRNATHFMPTAVNRPVGISPVVRGTQPGRTIS